MIFSGGKEYAILRIIARSILIVVNVNYDDLKVQIKDLIEAAIRGDKVIITKDCQQVVQMVPMKTKRKQPKFGSAKGKIKFTPDFDAPLADFSEYAPQ